MIYQNDIVNLKTNIAQKIGQKIIVKGMLGRSKPFEKEATIEKIYPNIFVVRYEENNRSDTYTYKDILTRSVDLQVYDGEHYNSLIPQEIITEKKKKEAV